MSSTGYATPLNLELRPSWRLGAFLAVSHVGAAAALLLTSLPWWAVIGLASVIAASMMRLVTRFALFTDPRAIDHLEWLTGGEWRLSSRDGTAFSGVLLPGTYLHPWLVVLAFRVGRSRRNVVILPDMLDSDTFRRLRVRLRLTPQRNEGNTR